MQQAAGGIFLIVTSTAALTIILHFICLGYKEPYERLWLVTLASTFREMLASLDLLLVCRPAQHPLQFQSKQCFVLIL